MDFCIPSYIFKIITMIIVITIAIFVVRKGMKWLYSNAVILSPHMPPSWTFGVVWTFIYLTYTYIWCDITEYNVLFSVSI
jgi:tryptophan-rich sensory protein